MSYVRERFFKGGDFSSVAHLKAEAQRWCLEVAGDADPWHLPPAASGSLSG